MKIFLSARYSRRDELRAVREKLTQHGHQVVSRWLDTEWGRTDGEGSSAAPAEYREYHAVIDLEDVASCDWLVAFTEEARTPTRGGRHVEMGYALGLGKCVAVVGHRENIFCHLPSVAFCSTVDVLFEWLAISQDPLDIIGI